MYIVIKIKRDVLNLTEELTGERQSGASEWNQEYQEWKDITLDSLILQVQHIYKMLHAMSDH